MAATRYSMWLRFTHDPVFRLPKPTLFSMLREDVRVFTRVKSEGWRETHVVVSKKDRYFLFDGRKLLKVDRCHWSTNANPVVWQPSNERSQWFTSWDFYYYNFAKLHNVASNGRREAHWNLNLWLVAERKVGSIANDFIVNISLLSIHPKRLSNLTASSYIASVLQKRCTFTPWAFTHHWCSQAL